MSDSAGPRYDDEFLDAAARVFRQEGFCGTTLERLAAEADVSAQALRRRGVTRDGLLEAIATRSAHSDTSARRVHGS